MIISAYGNVGLVMLALLPLAALVVWGLHSRRSGAAPEARRGVAWRTSLAEVGIVYGTLPWLWLIAQPGSSDRLVDRAVHLDPLRDLVTMPPYQIIGNLLVFSALGFFAPMRFGWAGVGPAGPGARSRLLAAGRDLAVRRGARSGLLPRRRPAQQRRCRSRRARVASLVAHGPAGWRNARPAGPLRWVRSENRAPVVEERAPASVSKPCTPVAVGVRHHRRLSLSKPSRRQSERFLPVVSENEQNRRSEAVCCQRWVLVSSHEQPAGRSPAPGGRVRPEAGRRTSTSAARCRSGRCQRSSSAPR